MSKRRKLPCREYVFVGSLLRHGFRHVGPGAYMKESIGYIIAASRREDASGIDFLIKMPGDNDIYPVQITQFGTRIYRRYKKSQHKRFDEFLYRSQLRVNQKRLWCRKYGIVFVLVRDFIGEKTTPGVARRDLKALHHGISSMRR